MSNTSIPSDDTLIAAFLTKPVRPGIVRGRKEPLMFTKRTDFFASLPQEPEDAKLTGATRSLYRRLLALNLKPISRMPVSSATPVLQPEIKIA